ncbi:MAG: hypothetical protein HQM08_29040 [Candidatus Riflebacteria bacterium]|nr:hypothetical protein [Candidatus Riflebacteria bacterium]
MFFNSDMVLYYFKDVQSSGEELDDLDDRNVVSDYGKIGRLFDIGGFDSERMSVLDEIVEGKEQKTKITDQFNLEVKISFDLDEFISWYNFLLITLDDRGFCHDQNSLWHWFL